MIIFGYVTIHGHTDFTSLHLLRYYHSNTEQIMPWNEERSGRVYYPARAAREVLVRSSLQDPSPFSLLICRFWPPRLVLVDSWLRALMFSYCSSASLLLFFDWRSAAFPSFLLRHCGFSYSYLAWGSYRSGSPTQSWYQRRWEKKLSHGECGGWWAIFDMLVLSTAWPDMVEKAKNMFKVAEIRQREPEPIGVILSKVRKVAATV